MSLSLSVPWGAATTATTTRTARTGRDGEQAEAKQTHTNALSSSRSQTAGARVDPRSDGRVVYMDASQPIQPTHSRWRRPSLSKRHDDKPDRDAAHAQPQIQTQASSSSASPPALTPAPDSRTEIKRLLRSRDEDAASDKDSECSRPMKAIEEQAQRQRLVSASAVDLRPADASIVPDFLPVQPIQDIPDVAALAFRSKYNVHNPVGPRWYKNHHLIGPQTRFPLSSTFSPAFPPIPASAAAGSSADVGLMPGPSRTPSGSPLPTPNASQTVLGDGPVRSRKVSQTAHDNVDMLDATDPYGTNWHHQSPYDVGGLNAPPPQDQPRSNGSRTSSTARQNGRLPNPSPLSQSTSAVHLPDHVHPLSATVPPRKRTLSKPAAGIRRFFSGSSSDDLARKDIKVASAPVTPVDGRRTPEPAEGLPRWKLSRRGWTAPTVMAVDADPSKLSANGLADKKGNRTSILGRIGKKLSILRAPTGEVQAFGHRERRSEELDRANKRLSMSAPPRNDADLRRPNRRVPPPESKEEGDGLGRRYSASIDLEFSLTMGNLTITNPDQPGSSTASPGKRHSQLLSEAANMCSPAQSVAPLPPPKRSPPLLAQDEDTDSEGEEQPRMSVLRVTNTPNNAYEDLPPTPVSSAPPSPLLPPIRPFAGANRNSYASSGPESSVKSPAVISISLSTASFSSPPPPPEKSWAFVDPATLIDSPMQQDFDLLPDIASEPDYDTIPEASTSRTPRHHPQSSFSLAAAAAEVAAVTQSPLPMGMNADERARLLSSDLSRASLFVNPPTPLAPPASMPMMSAPAPMPEPSLMSHMSGSTVVPDREREHERAIRREAKREEKERAKREEREREEKLRREEREKEREREERARKEEWEREREREERARREEREREKERERERGERVRREEREREKEREREREEKARREEREREKEREKEREERARREEREREKEREREERARREEREREREREEKVKREEREREKEKERRERIWREEREKERLEKARREESEKEKEKEREEKARREEREREREERARRDERDRGREERARREESEREERRDERDRERALRHERRASRLEDKTKREPADKERSSRRRTSTTETFRLVRSPSDMRLMQVNAIPVGEEQWTVVEAPSSTKRDKGSRREKEKERDRDRDRDKERERSSPEKSSRRRESKRDDKYESSRSQHRHSIMSESKEDRRKSTLTLSRTPADDPSPRLRHQRSRSPDEHKSSDVRSSERDKDRKSGRHGRESRHAGGHSSDSRSSQARTSGENQRPSHGSLAPPGAANLEPHSSLRRAVSDVPAGADQLLSLSAREVWTTERMWKGKSAAFDPDAIGSIHGGSSYDPRASQYSEHSSAAGTIGTFPSAVGSGPAGYMVQSPFYEHAHPPLVHQNSFYAVPVSVAAQPVVFPTQAVYSPGRYDYPNAYRSYADSMSYGDASGPLTNPLPDPPRQSTYSPEPLLPPNSARQEAADDPLTPEFWRQYAGITTH
ncbi:hypothetical protein M0805_007134 [Coniferiporia weirii]|nr:hypothetical protein M0805_007134 [Coniferiporia weirii]